MIVEFTLSVDIDTADEIDEKMKEELYMVLSGLEEVLGRHGMNLDNSSWEEI